MKNRTGIMVAVSIILIIISSQIPSYESKMLGALQQLLLGIGMVGCLLAMWKFMKGGKKKNK
ncbi:hypothetical protein SAMN04487895_111139 [Paenibacillus sophorae]|uniref:Uncharacterized protein n=1 Tax=Paenibacillus sophorae TaxID=1333845 RepID=A0A1H8SF59_9BACL|nr:hypothetical protein [Paenibacillus sophorae]QWU16749.1 hypothetical protein KP014_05920 [Paenibacillus sophorae]SEO76994.1 hypothetical protein SAMN04487895_111139 [Paenibacillus sophorae]